MHKNYAAWWWSNVMSWPSKQINYRLRADWQQIKSESHFKTTAMCLFSVCVFVTECAGMIWQQMVTETEQILLRNCTQQILLGFCRQSALLVTFLTSSDWNLFAQISLIGSTNKTYILKDFIFCTKFEVLFLVFQDIILPGQYILHIKHNSSFDKNLYKVNYLYSWTGIEKRWVLMMKYYNPNI